MHAGAASAVFCVKTCLRDKKSCQRANWYLPGCVKICQREKLPAGKLVLAWLHEKLPAGKLVLAWLHEKLPAGNLVLAWLHEKLPVGKFQPKIAIYDTDAIQTFWNCSHSIGLGYKKYQNQQKIDKNV